MSTRLETLRRRLLEVFGERIGEPQLRLGELTVEVPAANYLEVARALRDHAELHFEQLIDLSGIDYSTHAQSGWSARFAVVVHLTSLRHNWRLRLRVFAPDDAYPCLPSLVEVWNSANWYEREAFDMFGIMFDHHPDLRRILTDYGFNGHPLRKDFPVSGHVEMCYDPEQGRVVYQPVTIEPRENVPRIVREERYGQQGGRGGRP